MPLTKSKLPNILKTNPLVPEQSVIRHAAKTIESGGIVVIPTLGLYGMAADAFNPQTLKRIFDLKNRPETNPLLIFIKNSGILDTLVTDISPDARKLMAAFWPGKVTLIFHAQSHLSNILTAGTGKIGIRVPGHPVTDALVQTLSTPITGTSANLSGEQGCNDISSLSDSILTNADLILDAGPLKGGPGSTVIDTTCHPVRILREGAISSAAVFKALS